MFNSVFRNLLSNAVKFTPANGKVTIRSKTGNNDMIEVSVQDTGLGISIQNIGRLFRIDEKVSSPGTEGEPSTGLGLILAKEFIAKQGGQIWVESNPVDNQEENLTTGKAGGSTFYFSLPVKKINTNQSN